MLKAKTNRRSHTTKDEAMREVVKEENLKRLNVNLPKSLYLKLKAKLSKDDITISDWLRAVVEVQLSSNT